MSGSTLLNTAQANKKDEFYTQIGDIEKELMRYKSHFEGKAVYCNCDDPLTSNFALFFKQHFDEYGLTRLICSCYDPEKGRFFSKAGQGRAMKMDYTGGGDTPRLTEMRGNGDFRRTEALALLRECDIVVTNPPFSLFREFISLMARSSKKFLVLGNINAVSYKECFSLIKAGKMWLGHSIHSGDREFRVPQDYPLNASGTRVDDAGNRYIRVKGVRWFTNMEYEGLLDEIPLTARYDAEHYPKFDNVDAINVSKTRDIPYDYDGLMGVPITFMDKYNPNQFEIVGNEYTLGLSGGRCYLSGKRMYSRIFIRRRHYAESGMESSQAVSRNEMRVERTADLAIF